MNVPCCLGNASIFKPCLGGRRWETSSPALLGGTVQSAEDVLEQDAAGLAVDVVAVASLPEMLQVAGVLHHLLETETKTFKDPIYFLFHCFIISLLYYLH